MLIGHDYFKFKLVALKRAIGFVSYLYCTIIEPTGRKKILEEGFYENIINIYSRYEIP